MILSPPYPIISLALAANSRPAKIFKQQQSLPRKFQISRLALLQRHNKADPYSLLLYSPLRIPNEPFTSKNLSGGPN